MKKKIVSFISVFILMMLLVAVLPEEKADAASQVTITSIDVVESSVDVSSGATTVTVNVGECQQLNREHQQYRCQTG